MKTVISHSDKNMHTERQKLGAEKNSADKNAHYNVCMVLKIKQQDAIVLLLQARREYRLLRGKKARGLFLDRLSEETGYDRKHLIKLLRIASKKRIQQGIAVSPAVMKFYGCLKIRSTIILTCT